MDLKHNMGLKDGAFDKLLFMLHHFILPAGNLLPPSYLAERVLEVLSPDDCMWHACPNGKCPPWPPLSRSLWRFHTFDKCACGLHRMIETTRPNSKSDVQPAKVRFSRKSNSKSNSKSNTKIRRCSGCSFVCTTSGCRHSSDMLGTTLIPVCL
jgi:hypothetical protein